METPTHHLDETLAKLQGASKELLTVFNQWAAIALDQYHAGSRAELTLTIDGRPQNVILVWNSNFPKEAMRERKKMAEEGGLSLAMFVMSVLLNFKYVQQTEIGEGVDYRFQLEIPTSDNFLLGSHYVEVSGLLEESPTNTLKKRIEDKHKQIDRGRRSMAEPSSVIVTLFKGCTTVKELHQ
jgi:hypothetical protein